MKQSLFLRARELFLGSDIVRKYSFRIISTWDNCALLVKVRHQLTQVSAISREESAHFQEYDCFECLSPHEIAA